MFTRHLRGGVIAAHAALRGGSPTSSRAWPKARSRVVARGFWQVVRASRFSLVLLAFFGVLTDSALASAGAASNSPTARHDTAHAAADAKATQPESPVAGLTRPAVVTLRGDLDCVKLVGEVRAAVEECSRAECGVVVLELSGTRWRADVALQIAEVLRQAREQPTTGAAGAAGGPNERRTDGNRRETAPRIVVFLNGANADDGLVGGGQAALALIADACVIGPQTRVEASSAQQMKDLCPSGSACVKAIDELREMIAARVAERARSHAGGQANSPVGASADAWAAALPTPSKPVWLAGKDPWSGQARALTTSKPRSGEVFTGQLICGPENAEAATLALNLSAEQSLDSKLAFAKATSATTALVALGVRGSPVKRLTVSADLAGARERLSAVLKDLDPQLRAVEQAARDAGYSRSAESLSRRRRIGQEGLTQLAALEEKLMAGEQVLSAYPELLLALPPGQTPVGQKSGAGYEGLWRTLLQDWRDRVASARARCKALAEARVD